MGSLTKSDWGNIDMFSYRIHVGTVQMSKDTRGDSNIDENRKLSETHTSTILKETKK